MINGTTIISVLSQKGGVYKSTLVRALAYALSENDFNVLLADLDTAQSTTSNWYRRRIDRGLPEIGTVKQYDGMSDVITEISEPNNPYDFVVVDSRGYTSEATLPIAESADMIIQPSGPTLDDLEPALAVFYELEANDIPKERLFFAITAVATPPELAAVRSYLRETEYNILDGFISFQAGYRMALDHGASILESPFESLNVRANELIGSIFKKLQSLQQ